MIEEKATHSSILAWEIPWTEESGRPRNTLHGVMRESTQDLATKQQRQPHHHLCFLWNLNSIITVPVL